MFILRIGIIICLLTIVQVPSANSQENHREALDLIYKFADKMCIAMPIEGQGSDLVLSGEAKAELNGLLGRLAELGVDGTAFFQGNRYKGVLQKDLVSALNTTTNCRIKIFMSLQDKLISNAPEPNSNGSSGTINSSKFFQYPVKVQTIETGEAISNARVIIEVLGKAPLDVLTDSDGFARVFIDLNRSGEPGRLTVQATGYREYSQNIDLDRIHLPHNVQLELQ